MSNLPEIISQLAEIEKDLQLELSRVQGAIKILQHNVEAEIREVPVIEHKKEPNGVVSEKRVICYDSKVCPSCGKTFTPTHNRQIFCVKDCNPKKKHPMNFTQNSKS